MAYIPRTCACGSPGEMELVRAHDQARPRTGDGVRAAPLPVTAIGAGDFVLTRLKAGQTARIRHAALEADDAALLRAMGLRPRAVVRICRAGEPCVVEVMSGGAVATASRIGLARPLAERVVCDPMPV